MTMPFTFDYTLIVVLLGTALAGALAGMLGVFSLLRNQTLLGDAISHAALPGIACAFLLTHTKSPLLLLCGGVCSGALGALLIHLITEKSSLGRDAALGVVLSAFFGVGLVLLTVIQKQSISNQSILNKFLFGNAATLLADDLYVLGAVSGIVCAVLFFFWKEFTLLVFDRSFAHALGYPVIALDALLTGLIVLAISVGLHSVGVVLMSALLLAPAAAARQWTHSLRTMLFLSACFGIISSCAGVLVSASFDHVPTGPSIIMIASVCVFISLSAPRIYAYFKRCARIYHA